MVRDALKIAGMCSLLLAVAGIPVAGAQCAVAFANIDSVAADLGNFNVEFLDDLHTNVPQNQAANLCAIEVTIGNNFGTGDIPARITLYDNDPGDSAVGAILAGPFDVSVPQGQGHVVRIDPAAGTVGQDMWIGVSWPGLEGNHRLVTGPASTGSSHDIIRYGAWGANEDLGALPANFQVTIESDAPVATERATWGRIKSRYP